MEGRGRRRGGEKERTVTEQDCLNTDLYYRGYTHDCLWQQFQPGTLYTCHNLFHCMYVCICRCVCVWGGGSGV